VFELTDEAIEAGIDTISGFLVAQAADRLGLTTRQTAQLFYGSVTHAQLRDPATGRYWDSLLELLDLFIAEVSGDPARPSPPDRVVGSRRRHAG
jgi:hypothetical protein